jgi:hypothetical protein
MGGGAGAAGWEKTLTEALMKVTQRGKCLSRAGLEEVWRQG